MSNGTLTTRREALAGLAALSLAGCGGSGGSGSPPVASSPSPSPTPSATVAPAPSLNTLAAQKGRRWGSAIAWNAGAAGGSIQNPDYAAIVKGECGLVLGTDVSKHQIAIRERDALPRAQAERRLHHPLDATPKPLGPH